MRQGMKENVRGKNYRVHKRTFMQFKTFFRAN